MKKDFLFAMMAIILAACDNDLKDLSESRPTDQTEQGSNKPQPTDVEGITVSVTDYIFADEEPTRTNIDATTLSFTWSESDVIGIYPNEGDQVSFPMANGAGTKTAVFDGGGWALRSYYKYSAYYPFSYDNYLGVPYTAVPHSYSGQKQLANNSTAHIGACDFMAAAASTPESGNVNFEFKHMNSLMYLVIKSSKADTFTQLEVSADEAIFVQDATIDISTVTMTPTKMSKSQILTLDNISVNAGDQLCAWLAMGPRDMSNQQLKIILTNQNGYRYQPIMIEGKNLEAGKAYKWDIEDRGKAVESITLDKYFLLLRANESEQLTATILPEDAANTDVVWSVLEENCGVEVDQDGLVTVKSGDATGTVRASSASNPAIYADCEVNNGEYVDLGITNSAGQTTYWAKEPFHYPHGDSDYHTWEWALIMSSWYDWELPSWDDCLDLYRQCDVEYHEYYTTWFFNRNDHDKYIVFYDEIFWTRDRSYETLEEEQAYATDENPYWVGTRLRLWPVKYK